MTPELKSACEVVFQEHKTSPINWNKDAFQGRISFGLSALAKETLVKKKIIYPNPEKKIITSLNPAVAEAATLEEAEELIKKDKQAPVRVRINERPAYIVNHISQHGEYTHLQLKVTGIPDQAITETKWYMKPLFYYFVWPVCAAVGGAFIAWFLSSLPSELPF